MKAFAQPTAEQLTAQLLLQWVIAGTQEINLKILIATKTITHNQNTVFNSLYY